MIIRNHYNGEDLHIAMQHVAKEVRDYNPAFPIVIDFSKPSVFSLGISTREYFAGKALTGILADNSTVDEDLLYMFGNRNLDRSHVAAQVAYMYADAMIEVGKKKV